MQCDGREGCELRGETESVDIEFNKKTFGSKKRKKGKKQTRETRETKKDTERWCSERG